MLYIVENMENKHVAKHQPVENKVILSNLEPCFTHPIIAIITPVIPIAPKERPAAASKRVACWQRAA